MMGIVFEGSIENVWVEANEYLGVWVVACEGVFFVAPIFVWPDENGKGLMVCVHYRFGPMWCFYCCLRIR